MSNILKTLAAGSVSGEYEIERSLRFNSADSAYLSRTPASAGNRKTWTWSGWIKRSGLTTTNFSLFSAGTADGSVIRFQGAGGIRLYDYDVGASAFIFNLITTPVYLDPSSWYHLVVAVDTTQATDSNRVKIYINGEQVTALSTAIYPSLNDDCYAFNNNVAHAIGVSSWVATNYFSGYMTEINFIDGSALTPSSFGETNATTGVWSPIAYAGSYGTNGFYLNFSDNTSTTTLGEDQAGSNNWTPNNFSVTAGAGNDSLVDTPTQYGTDTGAGGEVRGNYATLNAVSISTGLPYVSISNGNLGVAGTSAVNDGVVPATVSAKTGKYYWEYTSAAYSAGGYSRIGIMPIEGVFGTNGYLGGFANSCGYDPTGTLVKTGGNTTSWGATWGATDVIGVALDCDNGAVYFSKNGVFQNSGVPTSGASKTGAAITWTGGTIDMYPICDMYQTTSSGDMNFGQRPFAYTAPSGFKALVTTNLPDPTVVQGDEYFNTVLYTGTGSSLGVTGVGFQPDWVWIKERNGAADHGLYDAVRGTTKQLESNTTTAETTEATGLTAFGADGFTVGALAQLNTSADTYVAWNWKANGAGVSNTDGTITSTVSASIDSGFSIVTYTGTGVAGTVGHGLGVAPKIIIVKNRTTSNNWAVNVYNILGTTNNSLWLNLTNGVANVSTWWNSTAPAATVFSIGGVTNETNTSIDTFVAYCFAEVEGFSKISSYTGNGSADGPFVYTGFRPAWVMVKSSTNTFNWTIKDGVISPDNTVNSRIFPNLSDAEATNANAFDILSNGFKLRNTALSVNESGGTFIFAAFAENPVKFSLAR